MPFDDIACHVWAIDGYEDNTAANDVNDRYQKSAGDLKSVANNATARIAALNTLIGACRTSKPADPPVQIWIYGGFRRGQNAPEHMWFEYDGVIYDTMPERGLGVIEATPTSRECPYWETVKFGTGAVRVSASMTARQKAYLTKQGHMK